MEAGPEALRVAVELVGTHVGELVVVAAHRGLGQERERQAASVGAEAAGHRGGNPSLRQAKRDDAGNVRALLRGDDQLDWHSAPGALPGALQGPEIAERPLRGTRTHAAHTQ